MELIPLCEKVKKLSSICKICQHNANYTFRTAFDSDKLDDLIGGAEAYMPLCRECLVFKKAEKAKKLEAKNSENKVLYSEGGLDTASTTNGESTIGKRTPLLDLDSNKNLSL